MNRMFLLFAIISLLFSNSTLKAQGDLDEGIYWGYQAWHLAPNDGRTVSPSQWYHWFDDVNTGNTLGVDMYPDMSEYQVTYPTNLKYSDGSTATLYSAFDYETIDLHIKWMKDYGIKGCFLQRQNANITSSFQLEFRDTVTMHVIKACEKYGVKFCVMPCNNDKNTGGQQMIDKVINDWKHCVDDLKVLESPMYIKQNNKPVIGFWGLGFDNRPMLASEAHVILDFFQNKDGNSAKYEVYVMGGVPISWRTSPKEGGWDEVFLRLDMVSPWRTMFSTQSDGVSLTSNNISRMREDIDYCKAHDIDYGPVVSPGASTATQHHDADSFNWRKRSGGQFLWNQVYEVCKAYKDKDVQNRFIYGAMYDEVDEGTAIYKMAPTNNEAPAGTAYEVCTLDEDGYDLPSDWYLSVAGEAQKMLDGRIEISQKMSIDPNNPFGQYAYKEHIINLYDTLIIQAEDFDDGGEGVAYHDNDVSNNGGYYRTDEDVDIEQISGGYYVGWIENGEWLKYTVDVQDTGTYNFVFTAATEKDGGTISLSIDDISSGTATVINTGSYDNFSSGIKIEDVSMETGQHVVKLTFNDTMNFDYFEIVHKYIIDTTSIDTTVIDTTVVDTTVVDTTVSIASQLETHEGINVYPVPSGDVIYIEGEKIDRIQVFDLTGKLIINRKVGISRNLNVNRIDIRNYQNGIYILRITSANGNLTTRKIIISR